MLKFECRGLQAYDYQYGKDSTASEEEKTAYRKSRQFPRKYPIWNYRENWFCTFSMALDDLVAIGGL